VHFEKSIGMGYLPPELAVPGTKLQVKMQDRLWDCEVVPDSPYDPSNATIRMDG
jgi:dimethylglycine dehydrogenase